MKLRKTQQEKQLEKLDQLMRKMASKKTYKEYTKLRGTL